MNQPEFFVVGITHVDLAWKRGRDEMSEMMEIVVIRLLDLLEEYPTFRYHIEQVAHFRALQRRRPDLIARLQPFLRSGQLEFVGGMASTLESNLPNGECFVRNLQIGLQWIQDTWKGDAPVKTGWLVDTFGVPAQVPQILKGFGIAQLMANRFGGSHTRDLFLDRGLDGSQVMVAGWGTYAAYMRPENVAEQFCKDWDDVDNCFAKADRLTGPGPFLVVPYTENEMLVSRYPHTVAKQRDQDRPGQYWHSATPGDFLAAVQRTERSLPVVDGDLNPEFTGCFSLRHPIRLANRRVENLLLEAEKWTVLTGLDRAALLEEAWWELAYVQFHDVFTGSHPTVIFEDVMRVLGKVEAIADTALTDAFAALMPEPKSDISVSNTASVTVFNGLPWYRTDLIAVPIPSGWTGIARATDSSGANLPFVVEGSNVSVQLSAPATGYATIILEPGVASEAIRETVAATTIENEWIRMECDRVQGIGKLVWKPTGAVLIENAGNWLIAQRDDGNFQIENPAGAEVAAASGTLRLEKQESSLGQTVRLSGKFPPLDWAGPENHLHWSAEFFLPTARPEIRLALHLDWKGEATRVRLTLPTGIDSSTGIYEVPFGVVSRKPYSPRTNAKGEWPAHRFIALEDTRHGIALINTGVGGVEVSGGTIYTTLLRAPKGEYAGMVADATSSQHGAHDYTFAVVPYSGSWAESSVVQVAQEINNPLHSRACAFSEPSQDPTSFLKLEPANIVLSGIKAAADGSGDVIVRVYETVGRQTEAILTVSDKRIGSANAWNCDLREDKETGIPGNAREGLRFTLQPFQIRTLRFKRVAESGCHSAS